MDRRLKKWEVSLVFGVLVAILGAGWVQKEQKDLATQVIRLHVIANSNSGEDQALKLVVRDAILEEVSALSAQYETVSQMEQVLREKLPQLSEVAQSVVSQQGGSYSANATLGDTWFPTKEYDGFSFPAGEYRALCITLGEGAGENWWCVAFPPLCVGAASGQIDQAIEAGYFSAEQGALVTGDGEGYVLKFKVMELLGQLLEPKE